MIRFIAAIDSKRGMANDETIPWYLPADRHYFREQTEHSTILMGYGTYLEFSAPLQGRHNYVASSKKEALRDGFELVNDAVSFLQDLKRDVWVIGGPGLFTQTLGMADELYLTRIHKDFKCTKFFPPFTDHFKLKSQTEEHVQNGIVYEYEIWERK